MVLKIERNSLYRWVNEKSDPSAKTGLDIVRALKDLNPAAAQAFVERCLVEKIKDLYSPTTIRMGNSLP